MSEVSFLRVISCSSEDSGYSSSNLLNSTVASGKWRCKTGEKSASVVLQLDRSVKIGQIDVGNNGSAFVEMLVGRSTNSLNDFSVIVPSSSFMSPAECKVQGGSNTCRVRMFGFDKLTKPVCDESWDLLKIVCTQPFNKTVPFGVSFVKVYTLSEKQCSNVKEATNDNLSKTVSGSLVIKSPNKAPIRPQVEREPESKMQPSPAGRLLPSVPRPELPIQEVKRSIKRSSSPENVGSPSYKRPKAKEMSTGKSRPLSGVVFVLSGFQNPDRSNLRNKAIELGARYEADWSDGCTHLICAFANTPKFNQVKGKGKIVSKRWIEDCHAKKELLDWHKYDMCSKDFSQSRSESPTSQKTSADTTTTTTTTTTADTKQFSSDELTDQLPNIFLSRTFYIHPSVELKMKTKVERLIVTFGGSLMDKVSSATDFVIADNGSDVSELEINHPEVILTRPDWIIACQRKQRLLPHDQFTLS